ncbi:MAG: ribonuclease P subunit P30 [Methanobacteriaceae archaeon]|jgi:ribonuclease P/MRP protein subunit RPP1|nr:ribonuclease P subunit P30 [Candidatus Methanorudis spinitermitis]
MKYHDLNIRGSSYESDLRLILEANKLGWNYVNLIYSPDKYNLALKYRKDLEEKLDNIIKVANLKNKTEFEFGIEIKTRNPNDIRKNSRKFRNKTKFISIFGGDSKINRMACENIQIDLLSRPYLKRRDCGINHVLAKEAFKNNVAIELCFKDILTSYLSYRAKILSHFRDIIKLHQKFKFPLLITTGSSSIFDVRSPKDVSAVFKSIGLNEEEINSCFNSYPENIISFNNDRKDMVVLGVKEINR